MNFYEWFFLEKGRAPAGLFSWSHLLSVTLILGAFVALAIILGKRLKGNPKGQWKVFLATTIAILALAVMKMSFLLATTTDIGNTFLENLPPLLLRHDGLHGPNRHFHPGKGARHLRGFHRHLWLHHGIYGQLFRRQYLRQPSRI